MLVKEVHLLSRRGRRQSLAPVIGFIIQNPMDSATRVGHVTPTSRIDVHMGMIGCLACGETVIHTNVERIRLESDQQSLANLGN
jgi:hypothetical protein